MKVVLLRAVPKDRLWQGLSTTGDTALMGQSQPVEMSKRMHRCRRSKEAARFQMQAGTQPHVLRVGLSLDNIVHQSGTLHLAWAKCASTPSLINHS